DLVGEGRRLDEAYGDTIRHWRTSRKRGRCPRERGRRVPGAGGAPWESGLWCRQTSGQWRSTESGLLLSLPSSRKPGQRWSRNGRAIAWGPTGGRQMGRRHAEGVQRVASAGRKLQNRGPGMTSRPRPPSPLPLVLTLENS